MGDAAARRYDEAVVRSRAEPFDFLPQACYLV